MRLLATRVVTIGDRDVKMLIARLQYEDALHADIWRNRVVEMRVSAKKLDHAPDKALVTLFDEAEHMPDTFVFLLCVTSVLKQKLCDAYRDYIAVSNDLADYPTVRLMKMALLEEREHVQLLQAALHDYKASSHDDRVMGEMWVAKLNALIAACGELDGNSTRVNYTKNDLHHAPYHLPLKLNRDDSLPRVWDFVKPPLEEIQPHLNYMMAIRLSEVNVAEGLAIVLCETPNMAWTFYFDIARHLWDEARHSLFGEAAIEQTYGKRDALPMRDYEGVYALEASTLEQYAVLGLELEGKYMRYPPGKRQEWEFARDSAKHPLMTTFQDYDWADEVLHVNIARKQLDKWFEGGLKHIANFSASGKAHRDEVKRRHQPVAI